MSSNDSKKRKAAFDEKCAANKKTAKCLRTRMDNKTKLAYFKECFKAKDFKECDRLCKENKGRVIDYLSESFISRAIETPDIDKWGWLFEHGVDANARFRTLNGKSWTMLMQAAEVGDLNLCELVLDNCPSTINERNHGNDKWTALMFAARENNQELCKLLVEKGANIHIESTTDSTALDIARDNNAFDVVAYFESLH
jgi:hypothetical protein